MEHINHVRMMARFALEKIRPISSTELHHQVNTYIADNFLPCLSCLPFSIIPSYIDKKIFGLRCF